MTTNTKQAAVYWTGTSPVVDDFGEQITAAFVDGKTRHGPWAIMSPASFVLEGIALGTGRGQKYEKQADGRWLKTEG
jgi:hypothetical protein